MAGTFGGDAQARLPSGRAMRAPTVRIGEVGADAFIGPCRAAASREGRGGFGGRLYRRTQRPPCVKGPQGSAACGGRSDRSGPAAACLGGPRCGPPRLRGNPELSAARLTGGLTEEFSVPLELKTPPALRATSPYTGEALDRCIRQRRSGGAGMDAQLRTGPPASAEGPQTVSGPRFSGNENRGPAFN